MTDTVDKQTRSRVMSSIAGSNTKMELAVKQVLGTLGFEHQPKGVFGKPDFANAEHMVAVFLDGCFWHGCPEHYKAPGDNAVFWAQKVARNRTRDMAVTRLLEDSGWRVIRVWEHEFKELLKA